MIGRCSTSEANAACRHWGAASIGGYSSKWTLQVENDRLQVEPFRLGPPSCESGDTNDSVLGTVACNQHRAVGVSETMLADRAEQHAGEFAVAPTAHDEQVRAPGRLHQHWCGVALHDPRAHRDVWVSLA